MKHNRITKFILTIILCVCIFPIGSYAMGTTQSGVVSNRFVTIYPSNSLNAEMISQFNEMSDYDRAELMPYLTPLYFKTIGILSKDAYARTKNHYNALLHQRMGEFSTPIDYYNSDIETKEKNCLIFTNGTTYFWYEDFDHFLASHMYSQDEQLIVDNNQNVYYIYNQVIEEEQEENGVMNIEMYSYKNINSSNFGNLSQYSRFIGLCNEHRDKGYLVILKNSPGNYPNGHIVFGFPKVKPNIYNNGITLGYTIRMCDSNGIDYKSFDWFQIENNNVTDVTTLTSTWTSTDFMLGGSSLPLGGSAMVQNNAKRGLGIYSLSDSKTNMTVFTSLAGWVNNQGHYEPTYILGTNYGQVPSSVITPNDITTYYNQTYTDNSQHNTVYYPPNYNENDNGYDETRHTLSFDGISNFLSSLGNLIGSLINGFAQALANLINSIISVVNNIQQNVLQGVIFDFLKAFMTWLPIEIVSMITCLFVFAVFFGIIKLIRK